MQGNQSRRDAQPFEEVVQHARVLAMLPALDSEGELTPEWQAWLASMDLALERAEIAARDESIALSLDLRAIREDLNAAVLGEGSRLRVDTEKVEALAIRAARFAAELRV
jgi:hypothetical protein